VETIKPKTSWVRLSEVIWRAGLAKSKGEARRLLTQRAIKVEADGQVHTVTDPLAVVTAEGVWHREAKQ